MRVSLLVVPAVVIIIAIGLIPTFVLYNYTVQTPYLPENKFVGLGHFENILSDWRWWDAWKRTLLFSVLALLIELPLGLGLALLLYKPGKFNAFVGACVTLPALIPGITVGLIWRLLTKSVGPVARTVSFFLNPLGIEYLPYQNPTHAFITILVMEVWHWTSLIFLVMVAALASIEPSPILSARTEGATRWQIFRYIQFPALRFSLVFVMLIRLMDSLRIYDEAVVLSGGGPGLTTEFLSLYIKRIAADQWLLGYAGAMSLIYLLMLTLLIITSINVITRGKGLA